jgi:DNA-binding transcriptional LysR family regulator
MNQARFDLRHLRYFVAVAEELNFRRAAERLFISQPPLSRQVSELETILGVRLFERDTTGVKLTPAGELALKRARKLLADADHLIDEMRRARSRTETMVRIAASTAVPVSSQKALAAAWKKALGTDTLKIEYGESKKLQPRLRRGEFDLALLGGPSDFSGLETDTVKHYPLVAAMAADHPAARRKNVSLSDLAGTRLFWFPRTYNPGYYDHCAAIFARSGFQPDYLYVEPGQLVTLDRISHGEGFSLLTTVQAAMTNKNVAVRPLKEGKALGIVLVATWLDREGDKVHTARAKKFAAAARRTLEHT